MNFRDNNIFFIQFQEKMNFEVPIQIALIQNTEKVRENIIKCIGKCETKENLQYVQKLISRYMVDKCAENDNEILQYIYLYCPVKFRDILFDFAHYEREHNRNFNDLIKK